MTIIIMASLVVTSKKNNNNNINHDKNDDDNDKNNAYDRSVDGNVNILIGGVHVELVVPYDRG